VTACPPTSPASADEIGVSDPAASNPPAAIERRINSLRLKSFGMGPPIWQSRSRTQFRVLDLCASILSQRERAANSRLVGYGQLDEVRDARPRSHNRRTGTMNRTNSASF